jgi:hypothetical protein
MKIVLSHSYWFSSFMSLTHMGMFTHKNYSSTLSLTSALDGVGGQRQAPTAFSPGKRRGTHCIRGLVGSRAGLDVYGKSRLHRDSIPGPSSPFRVAILFNKSTRIYLLWLLEYSFYCDGELPCVWEFEFFAIIKIHNTVFVTWCFLTVHHSIDLFQLPT